LQHSEAPQSVSAVHTGRHANPPSAAAVVQASPSQQWVEPPHGQSTWEHSQNRASVQNPLLALANGRQQPESQSPSAAHVTRQPFQPGTVDSTHTRPSQQAAPGSHAAPSSWQVVAAQSAASTQIFAPAVASSWQHRDPQSALPAHVGRHLPSRHAAPAQHSSVAPHDASAGRHDADVLVDAPAPVPAAPPDVAPPSPVVAPPAEGPPPPEAPPDAAPAAPADDALAPAIEASPEASADPFDSSELHAAAPSPTSAVRATASPLQQERARVGPRDTTPRLINQGAAGTQ
jgi:hypothetical protein